MHAGKEVAEGLRQPTLLEFGSGGVSEEGVVLVAVRRLALPRGAEVAVVARPESFGETDEDGVDEGAIGMNS